MNKVLLNKAINDESTFIIDNSNKTFSQPYYYVIKGRIKFLKLKKIKLNEFNLEGSYPEASSGNNPGALRDSAQVPPSPHAGVFPPVFFEYAVCFRHG